MNVLELKSISKSFNGIKVLEDVNLSLKKGERACLFGASGSGKSSLLYIAAGILPPDSGKILVMQKSIKEEKEILEARRRHFGFVFQFHNLVPELTVYENILIAQEICGKRDKDFMDFLLNELGLLNKKNQKPQTLSGGEAQRVSVIRAFATKPSIVFADEPTGSLDPETGEKTINLILSLSKNLETTLFTVSHNQTFKIKFEHNFEILNRKLFKI